MNLSSTAREWLAAARIAVLVSGRTANGAELFARFLHKQRQATVVGEPTAGLSFVSEVFSLRPDALVLMPVAELRSAQDFSWVDAGLIPNSRVDGVVRGDWGDDGDAVLRRAIAVLSE